MAAWTALVVLAIAWGTTADGRRLALRAWPFYGDWDPLVTARIVPALVVAAAVVAIAPAVASRVRFPAVALLTGAGAVAWSLALALVDGWSAVTDPLRSRHEYLGLARRVTDLGAFVDTFTERITEYPIHVQGHPPGLVTLLAGADRLGVATDAVVAALFVAGGAVAAGATVVIARVLAGEAAARRAAPFLVLAPAALWVATTADALFAGVVLGGVAVLAISQRRATAAAGGAVLAVAVHLSYGLVLVAPLVLAVLARRRAWRLLPLVAAGGAAVTVAFLLAGFAWWEGLAATHGRYVAGVSSSRPYWPSLAGNLAVVAVMVGPATAAGLASARGRLRWVVAPSVLAVLLADASGMAKGEVERIWLFLVPGLVVATGALTRHTRVWLAANGVAGLALATMLRSPW